MFDEIVFEEVFVIKKTYFVEIIFWWIFDKIVFDETGDKIVFEKVAANKTYFCEINNDALSIKIVDLIVVDETGDEIIFEQVVVYIKHEMICDQLATSKFLSMKVWSAKSFSTKM